MSRPRKYNTPEEMQIAIDDYFETCEPAPLLYETEEGEMKVATDKNGKPIIELNPPTITGLALHLGFESRQSMYDYEGYDKNFSYTIKRARLKCEHAAELNGMSGKSPAAMSIFALKNYGWSDRQEIEHSGEIKQGEFVIIGIDADADTE